MIYDMVGFMFYYGGNLIIVFYDVEEIGVEVDFFVGYYLSIYGIVFEDGKFLVLLC